MYDQLYSKSKRVRHPKSIKFTLMGHQLASMHAMSHLENTTPTYEKNQRINTKLGILGDPMGAGKTHAMIAFLAADKTKVNKIYKEVRYLNNFISICKIDKKPQLKTNLIITPTQQLRYITSILEQTKLKYHVVRTKKDISSTPWSNRKLDIMVCSDCKYKEFIQIAHQYQFKRIIINKADLIKLPTDMKWNGNFIWLMTNKPYEITNSVKKYTRTLFNVDSTNVGPNAIDTEKVLKQIIVRNTQSHVDTYIKPVKPISQLYRCVLPKGFDLINNVVSKRILDLVTQDKVDDAIISLKCNVNTTQSVLKQATQHIQDRIDEINQQPSTNASNASNVSNALNALRTQYTSIEQRVLRENNKCCLVCFAELSRPTLLTCCNHLFCFKCVIKSFQTCSRLNPTCPHCRSTIDFNNMHVIDDTNALQQSIQSATTEKSKLETLRELVHNYDNPRVLVVSNNVENIRYIKSNLETSRIFKSIKEVNGNCEPKECDNQKYIIFATMEELQHFSPINIHYCIFLHKMSTDDELIVEKKLRNPMSEKPLRLAYLMYENEFNICDKN